MGNTALIINASALLYQTEFLEDYKSWRVPDSISGLLRDIVAMGRRIVILLPVLESGTEKLALRAIKKALLNSLSELPFDFVCIQDLEDPRPIWNHTRKCGVNLHRTILIGDTSSDYQLGKNSGIGHFEWGNDFFRAHLGLERNCA